ncbi:MAG: hypothetical protein JSS98_20275 [Bacteroidetes bacterium]|nr:hypothetical protein [Bacteroidota bacterium]
MFFKEYFNSVADIIQAKFKGHISLNQNNADRGELCEIFIKDFLFETMGDSFKIARGGKIIDWKGNHSKQLDVILTAKKSLKLFSDKGIYPTETVYGAISITSTLSKKKILDCCKEFMSIPKENFQFSTEGYIDQEYLEQTANVWKNSVPYKVVFAYGGSLKEDWIKDILKLNKTSINPYNTIPDLIILNKKGFIEKSFFKNKEGKLDFKLQYISFEKYDYYGVVFAKMLFHLNAFSHEEIILKPDLSYYFNQDL